MVERVFLGWEEPFVGLAADWLLSHAGAPEETLVIVPTGQSARELKRRLAQQAGATLSPRITTPGSLMRKEDPAIAPDWLESHAWQEILERQTSPDLLESLFSDHAQFQGEWAGGLAAELVHLRRSLQDNGLMLRDIAKRLQASPESDRWAALADIESQVEAWLRKQGHQSRSDCMRRGIQLPEDLHHVILAGISELPPLVARTLTESELSITCLIAAPGEKSEWFCELGLPTPTWQDQALSWPGDKGSVLVAIDPKHQARQALGLAATSRTSHEDLALGSADTEVGNQLAHEFSAAGWPSHHPAAQVFEGKLRQWLYSWNQWLLRPDLASFMELLSSSMTSKLIEDDCAKIADQLSQLRDRWMVLHPDDLRHQLQHGDHKHLKREALEVIRACEKLEKWKKLCDGRDMAGALRHLISALEADLDASADILQLLDEAADEMSGSKRSISYWLQLLLNHLPTASPTPPEGRVLDVHGWLELLFQPGRHLIICGMNEGKLPAAKADDPWLGEGARDMLGLRTESSRAARDAFLLESMLHSRICSGGRVDLLCARNNEKGEPMLPSRLLLAAKPDEISPRIDHLFREIEPVDAKLRWEMESSAKWKTPSAEAPQILNATSFRDYLACPFRYYLKHVHDMRSSDPERIEWNARDFGNVMHNVLEAWGRDGSARQLTTAKEIEYWLNQQLDLQVQHTFNQRIPLAVRIQLDAIRQRLGWFAQEQEELIGLGWQVSEVEHKFEILIGNTTVRAKIDRIDRHLESGQVRIIDYKTGGKDKTASSAHRTKQTSNSKLPAHISKEDPAIYERGSGKKTQSYLWKDLQLPLYALAIHARDNLLATPCYFKLGETRKEVRLNPWDDFDEEDLESARACAHWVSQSIADRKFTPIAEKPRYDDYELLWCTRSPEEVMATFEA